MKGFISAVMAAWLLFACVGQASPPKTLAEKLEGKTPQERTRTIRNICLTEAEWRRDQLIRLRMRQYGARWVRIGLPYMPDVFRLKTICTEMTKLYPGKKE